MRRPPVSAAATSRSRRSNTALAGRDPELVAQSLLEALKLTQRSTWVPSLSKRVSQSQVRFFVCRFGKGELAPTLSDAKDVQVQQPKPLTWILRPRFVRVLRQELTPIGVSRRAGAFFVTRRNCFLG